MNGKKVIINFKAYEEASGEKAYELARSFSNLECSENVIVAPDLVDTSKVSELDITVYSQHVDGKKPGSNTGSITAQSLKASNVDGALINHSERRLDEEDIEEAVEACKEYGLECVVCAQNVDEVERYSDLKPGAVAFEPPELIGGDVPVSEAEPDIIKEAVERTSEGVDTLTGAGIKTTEDVKKSIELGCRGVLVASGVVKSDDPSKKVKKLCEGL